MRQREMRINPECVLCVNVGCPCLHVLAGGGGALRGRVLGAHRRVLRTRKQQAAARQQRQTCDDNAERKRNSSVRAFAYSAPAPAFSCAPCAAPVTVSLMYSAAP
jgi:hypothetical protein